MGYLKQLDVENFKSWEGKQIIGPFMRFNCIIGTNGSGKSNLMDALGFVMGERASSLRVKHLRDLIHGAHIGRPASTSASVTMRYCDEHGGELRFSRTVSGDSSDFYINGKHVTLSIYTVELEKIGIVVKARNCLVFQGAVETIAMKNAKERTKMFERISSSVDLAEEYNTKHAALMKAKEETQFNFNRKRSAVAERKQIFKDKTEAVKYQALLNELGQSKLQLSLFRMYHTEQRVFKLFSCIREKQEDVTAKMRSVEKWEQLVKVQKKENGRLNREMQQTEKEIRVQEQNLSHQRTQYIKAKVNTSHHERKAEANRASLHESYKQREQKKQDLTELHKDLDDLERAWKAYAREMEVHRATQEVDVHLEEAQLERYRMLKESATRQAAGLRQQAEKLRWQVKADQEKLEVDKRRKYEVEVSIKNGQTQLEDCTKRAEKLKEYVSTCNASLEELRQREHSLMEELEQGKDRRQQVNKELCEVLGALQNARLDSHESHRQRKRQEAVESLRRQYPDTLIGRLVDLCQPIHKKFQLAITKVFGHHMNAIVVTSEKVACECIKFLKQERAEPETFLPIDYLDVTPLNERLREIRGTKLVVDVVQCATQLKKVVQYVCGNALVCETIKEARHVAFDGPARLKTVSLDGTMFSKSGVISGGSLHLRSKACRWDEKDMNELRERKERLTVELRDLMNLRQKEAELSQTRVQIQGIQTRLKYSMTELDSLHKRTIPACQAEISRLMSELSNLECQILEQTNGVEQKEWKVKQIKDRINETEDQVFADFCLDIGVSNIREYEQEHIRQQQELDRKCLQFESQRTRLRTQLEYEQGQLEQQGKKLKNMEDSISKEDEVIIKFKEEEKKLLCVVDEAQSKLLELQSVLTGKRSVVSESKAELDHNMKSQQEKELVKLQKEMISLEAALEQRRLIKHNLLQECKIDNIPITLLSGSLDDISDVQLDSESLSATGTLEIYEREEQMVMDYGALKEELKALDEDGDVEKEAQKLREVISSLEGVINRSKPPNLKALEKMQEVKENFRDVLDAFEASTSVAKKCNQEFEQVKAKRFRMFSDCFDHVSVVIDQIYKKLCRNQSAQAMLSPENPDEPYLGGINYNCVAPGKRFMAMDNLSGGEKTIAALALVFAIHSFRPAPFFVLDEVDAALDNSNIGKVTGFIREQSTQNVQVIVISLKEEFYSRSDVLLGVYSEFNQCMYSRLLSVDLRPYPLHEEDAKETDQDT
uniref:Structural maintenance of chromosomes protein n=1 Tax=Denticeps clupeoides TaxID=299321 RepID=A0AAY4CDZ0_9TELE